MIRVLSVMYQLRMMCCCQLFLTLKLLNKGSDQTGPKLPAICKTKAKLRLELSLIRHLSLSF